MAGLFDIVMPVELEGTTATVRAWLKEVGDQVRRDEPLVELETDKVTSEVPAPTDGILVEILLERDAPAEAGALLGRIEVSGAGAASVDEQPVKAAAPNAVSKVDQSQAKILLSPAVRRAIAQHGVDPLQVPGTGRNGRITRADVDRFVQQHQKRSTGDNGEWPAGSAPERLAEAIAPALTRSRTIPVDRMRRRIADNMLASVTAAPHVTAVFEADFSAIIAHRSRNKAVFEEQGISLTYTAYLVAASVAAMRASPLINGRWLGDSIEVFDHVNVGIGTSLGDKGLVVPVVHDAQSLSLMGVAERLQDITARARTGALKPQDLKDGTFTISNHGVSGSLLAAPIIIPQPQSAILGVGKLERRVVVREVAGVETIQIRPLAYVSLTIDHRIVDGHQTNAWLSQFVSALERWPPGN